MIKLSEKQPISLIILAAFGFTASCSSFRPIEATSRQQYATALEIGDRVRVTTLDGDVHEIEVVRVREEGVDGERTIWEKGKIEGREVLHIAFEDVARIEKREASPGKTAALLVSLVALAVAAAVLLSHLASKGAGSMRLGN